MEMHARRFEGLAQTMRHDREVSRGSESVG
jgi:hypothetical protein